MWLKTLGYLTVWVALLIKVFSWFVRNYEEKKEKQILVHLADLLHIQKP